MLLSCMIVFCAVFGNELIKARVEGYYSPYTSERLCHGERFNFPRSYSPPTFREKMYFTPSRGGSKRLVIEDGVIKDPRINVSDRTAYIADLTERDSGAFSVTYSFHNSMSYTVFTLDVSTCADPVTHTYGETYYLTVNTRTEFVEYSPNLKNPVVLWNRSDPQIGRGGRRKVRRGILEISSTTQEDNGYYDFWGKDRRLVSRILLTVEERRRFNDKHTGEELYIGYPSANSDWTVSVKLKEMKKDITLVKAGTLVTESDPDARQFSERVQLHQDGIRIKHLEAEDSGTYVFKDPQKNTGLTVVLEVKSAPPSMLVIICLAIAIIVALVICCCCVKRRCARKSSNRRPAAPQTAAARPANHHPQHQSQSSGSSYTAAHAPDQSYRPMNPGVSAGTAASSVPPAYTPAKNSTMPEFSPLSGQGNTSAPTFSADYLSSDPGPRFELKGLNIVSPLSSESTASDVYSSDKLNFLGAL